MGEQEPLDFNFDKSLSENIDSYIITINDKKKYNPQYLDKGLLFLKQKINEIGMEKQISNETKLLENIKRYLNGTIKPLINTNDSIGTAAILRQIVDTLITNFLVVGFKTNKKVKKRGVISNGLNILNIINAEVEYDYNSFEQIQKNIPPVIHKYSKDNTYENIIGYISSNIIAFNNIYDKGKNDEILKMIKNLHFKTEKFIMNINIYKNNIPDNFIDEFISNLAEIINNITIFKNRNLLNRTLNLTLNIQSFIIKEFMEDFKNDFPDLKLNGDDDISLNTFDNDEGKYNKYKKYIFHGNLLLIKNYLLFSPFIYLFNGGVSANIKNTFNKFNTKKNQLNYLMNNLLYDTNIKPKIIDFKKIKKDAHNLSNKVLNNPVLWASPIIGPTAMITSAITRENETPELKLFKQFDLQIRLFKIFGELYSKEENIIVVTPETPTDYLIDFTRTYNKDTTSGGRRRRKTTKNKTGKKVAKKSAKNKTAKKRT